jgi:hypothetical protein
MYVCTAYCLLHNPETSNPGKSGVDTYSFGREGWAAPAILGVPSAFKVGIIATLQELYNPGGTEPKRHGGPKRLTAASGRLGGRTREILVDAIRQWDLDS